MKSKNQILFTFTIIVTIIGYVVFKKFIKNKFDKTNKLVSHKKIADNLTDRQIKRKKARIYKFLGENPEYKKNINDLNNIDTVLLLAYLMLSLETKNQDEEYKVAAYKRENFTKEKIIKTGEILNRVKTI